MSRDELEVSRRAVIASGTLLAGGIMIRGARGGTLAASGSYPQEKAITRRFRLSSRARTVRRSRDLALLLLMWGGDECDTFLLKTQEAQRSKGRAVEGKRVQLRVPTGNLVSAPGRIELTGSAGKTCGNRSAHKSMCALSV